MVVRIREDDVTVSNAVLPGLRRETCAGDCADPDKITLAFDPDTQFHGTQVTRHMTDHEIPDYHRLSAQGVIFNNPMDSMVVSRLDKTYGFSNLFVGERIIQCADVPTPVRNWGGRVTGQRSSRDLLEGSLVSAPVIDHGPLIDLAVTQAWANVDLSQASAMMTLAEGGKTVSSMASIFKRLIKILIKLKKLQFGSLVRELSPKELAARYMELRYAIRPLVYEVQDITAAWGYKKLKRCDRVTFRGFKTGSSSYTIDVEQVLDARIYRVDQCSATRTVEVRAGVLTEVETDYTSTLNVWGADQLTETVWELIPFSFIVDWFFNVGSTIAALTPETGLKTLASWITVKDTMVQTVEVIESGVNSSYVPPAGVTLRESDYAIAGAKYVVWNFHKYRYPNPTVRVLPRCTVRLDSAKLADLLIIAKGIISSWGRKR